MVPRKQAGHMTCTRPQAERQNLLAMRASSTHDPEPTLDCASHNAESVIRGLPAAAWLRLSRPCTIAAKAQSLTEQDRWKLYGIGRLSRAPSLDIR
jgi:hypothetical protein